MRRMPIVRGQPDLIIKAIRRTSGLTVKNTVRWTPTVDASPPASGEACDVI